MTISDIVICNAALGKIGARSTISSLTEGSNESNNCNTYYELTRDAVLRQFRWNFSRAQINLAVLLDATLGQNVPVPWAYEYAYPSDCLKPWYLIPNPNITPGSFPLPTNVPAISADNPPVKYVVGTDFDSKSNRIKVILTNMPQAILVYGAKITDPTFFDSQFVELMVLSLAEAICIPLTGNAELRNSLHDELYNPKTGRLAIATAINANDQLNVTDHLPEWIRTRGFANGMGYPDVLGTDSEPGY